MEKRQLLPQHSRYDFVPLTERKDYSWPGGKRLAFLLTTNVEWFAFGAGLGHDPAKLGEPQTHRNYSWRDYGNRIGVWRLLELFDQLKLPAAHNANSLLYEYAPQIMAAIRARGDEVVAHGRTNAENLKGCGSPTRSASCARSPRHRAPRGRAAGRLDGIGRPMRMPTRRTC
jgi:hypothetical protein